MDKLQGWLERIRLAPKREVANLDYWELLLETRVAQTPVGEWRPALKEFRDDVPRGQGSAISKNR